MGWRSWAIVQQRRQLRLRSVVYDTVWPAQDELVAACNRFSVTRVPFLRRRAAVHEVPSARCGCGVHASNDLEAAADYLYLYDDMRQPHLRHRAIGRVSLWGTVVEGEKGWRGSRAYPERIFLPATDRCGRPIDVEAILDGLADYGVPIDVLEDDGETDVARAVRRVQPRRRRRRAAKTTS